MKNFKKLGFLTIAFVAILFSCSKDGGVEAQESDSVCGNVTDVDGNVYASVKIGEQCWMQKNLNVSKYRNGDIIPQVTDETTWKYLKTGAWCYYENKIANGTVYGKLYNWYAVNDPRGLAPAGFHIPSDEEWTKLTSFLGGEGVAGGKLKATTLWDSPNEDATNSSGFTCLPGGYRNGDGTFYYFGEVGYLWSATTSYFNTSPWYRSLDYFEGNVERRTNNEDDGLSVRCVRD